MPRTKPLKLPAFIQQFAVVFATRVGIPTCRNADQGTTSTCVERDAAQDRTAHEDLNAGE